MWCLILHKFRSNKALEEYAQALRSTNLQWCLCETHPTVENLSSSFHFGSVILSLSKDSIIWKDSKMTCYFSVKLLSFQMTDSILTLSFQMPFFNKTNCKWRQLYASISHLKMTGICQTRNEMQMTGSRLSDASPASSLHPIPNLSYFRQSRFRRLASLSSSSWLSHEMERRRNTTVWSAWAWSIMMED